MSQGLPRKLRAAFLGQFAIACLGIVLGFAALTALSRVYLAESWLRGEADYFWGRQSLGPAAAPNTRHVQGYFVAAGQAATSVPATMRTLAPGFHIRDDAEDIVLVDARQGGRLTLVVQESQLWPMMFWLSLVPLLLALGRWDC